MRQDGVGCVHASPMGECSRVPLPAGVGSAYEVYVNGVRQEEGADFTRLGSELLFPRVLKKEGRLGPWRWLSLFLGIHGTYRQNDSVDVIYEINGRRVVAHGLPIVTELSE
jgi:hypothetical protein